MTLEVDKFLSFSGWNQTQQEEWDKDTLQFWGSPAADDFPNVRVLARKIYIQRVTSTPTEQLFSYAKIIKEGRRNRTAPSIASDILFLHSLHRNSKYIASKRDESDSESDVEVSEMIDVSN